MVAQSSWEIRIIPQLVFSGDNTLQRPNNDEGTRIHLNKEFDLNHKVNFSPRVEVEYVYRRNHFILTGTLLKTKYHGISPTDIYYNGTYFPESTDMHISYRFNTYRIGYRYGLVKRAKFNFELGATLLIRDAAISMKDNSQKTKYSNVGVAPLISYYIDWCVSSNFSLLSYGDGFAIKYGRAFDLFAGVEYMFNDLLSATLGYRLLDGGSDVKKIYTMAQFNYIALGVNLSF